MYEYLTPGTVRRTFTDSNLSLIGTDADRFMKAAPVTGPTLANTRVTDILSPVAGADPILYGTAVQAYGVAAVGVGNDTVQSVSGLVPPMNDLAKNGESGTTSERVANRNMSGGESRVTANDVLGSIDELGQIWLWSETTRGGSRTTPTKAS
jgi:hypothetical protein